MCSPCKHIEVEQPRTLQAAHVGAIVRRIGWAGLTVTQDCSSTAPRARHSTRSTASAVVWRVAPLPSTFPARQHPVRTLFARTCPVCNASHLRMVHNINTDAVSHHTHGCDLVWVRLECRSGCAFFLVQPRWPGGFRSICLSLDYGVHRDPCVDPASAAQSQRPPHVRASRYGTDAAGRPSKAAGCS